MARSAAPGPYGLVHVAYQPILIAEYSYDVAVTLAEDRQASVRVPVRFDQGVIIVGFFASVRPAEWGSFAASGQEPTPEDLLVDWDLNKREHLTANESLEGVVVEPTGGWTTLAALNLDRRLIQKKLPCKGGAAPEVGFAFRWRGPFGAAPGAPPAPVSIRLTVFADPLREETEALS